MFCGKIRGEFDVLSMRAARIDAALIILGADVRGGGIA